MNPGTAFLLGERANRAPPGVGTDGPSMLGPYARGQAGSVPWASRFDADAGSARVGRNATERPRQPNPPPESQARPQPEAMRGPAGEKRELLPRGSSPPRHLKSASR